MTKTLERLHPESLSPELISLIEESKKWDESGTDTEEILGLIATGDAQIWCFTDEENLKHGIIITQFFKLPDRNELFIWRVYGSGILLSFDFIEAKLEEFAKKIGADSIGLETYPRMQDILLAKGFKCEDSQLIKELH